MQTGMFDVQGVHLERQQSSTQSKAHGMAFGCGLSLPPPKKRERPPTGIGRKEGESTSHPLIISVPVPREGFALAFSEGGCDKTTRLGGGLEANRPYVGA